MKLIEIKVGQFFTIDNTKSYPKLRTNYGYIDVRDEIKKHTNDIDFDLQVMSDEEVLKEFEKYNFKTLKDIVDLKNELLGY